MHYVLYLDEFGHIGPFISRAHPTFKTSPVFGLGGFLLPVTSVREFAIYFYRLKCHLLAWDLEHRNPERFAPYRWEKKGAALYTLANVTRYSNLRRATFRLINQINRAGGYVFYTAQTKPPPAAAPAPGELFKAQLLSAIQRVDRYGLANGDTFIALLDEQQAGNAWRERNVAACTLAMFESSDRKCRTLIEPPLQGESHLFQTLQCADWLCGLFGRLAAFQAAPTDYQDWHIFDRYFATRVTASALPGSTWNSAIALTLQEEPVGAEN